MIYRSTGSSYTCLFLFAVAFRKDAEASHSRYLLHLQVALVCCDRHRLSGVGFASNTVRTYMLTDYRLFNSTCRTKPSLLYTIGTYHKLEAHADRLTVMIFLRKFTSEIESA